MNMHITYFTVTIIPILHHLLSRAGASGTPKTHVGRRTERSRVSALISGDDWMKALSDVFAQFHQMTESPGHSP